MNILMISYFYRKKGGGGIASHLEILKRSLRSRGHRVFHITSRPEFKVPEEAELIQVKPVLKNYLPLSFFFRVFREFLKLKEKVKIDVIHCHSTAGLPAGIWERRIPVVTSIHATAASPVLFPPTANFSLLEKFFSASNLRLDKFFYALIRDFSDRIVFVSKKTKKNIEKKGISFDKGKVEIIAPGVETKYFYPRAKDRARKSLGLSGKFIILNVGKMTVEKGVLDLIKILPHLTSEIPRLKIIFIGSGPARQLILNELQRLDLRQLVEMIDHADNEVLPAYYNAADIFVNTTHENESFGLTTLEAMACRVPVIVSSEGADTGLVTGSNALVYEDSEDLFKKILFLFNNPSYRDKLAREGFKMGRSHSIDMVTERIEVLYRTVTSPPPKNSFYRRRHLAAFFFALLALQVLYFARYAKKAFSA